MTVVHTHIPWPSRYMWHTHTRDTHTVTHTLIDTHTGENTVISFHTHTHTHIFNVCVWHTVTHCVTHSGTHCDTLWLWHHYDVISSRWHTLVLSLGDSHCMILEVLSKFNHDWVSPKSPDVTLGLRAGRLKFKLYKTWCRTCEYVSEGHTGTSFHPLTVMYPRTLDIQQNQNMI